MADTPLHISDLVKRGKWVDYRMSIWGNSFTWSWERRTDEVEWLVVHHSVTKQEATPDDIALLHKARGWGGIGYHFVITKDGTVYYVGDVGTARANVKNKNEKVIGICLVGDFTKYNPSDDQIVSAHDLCKFFIEAPQWQNVKSWNSVAADLVGHKDLQATACPGTNWKGVADSMYERIKNRIPYSPQPKDDLKHHSKQWIKSVSEYGLGNPNTALFEDLQRVVAGYKSRATEFQTKFIKAEKDFKNREEQVERIKQEQEESVKFYKKQLLALNKSLVGLEEIKREYEGRFTAMQKKIDGMGREKGELNEKIGELKIEIQGLKDKNNELLKNQAQSLTLWDVIVIVSNMGINKLKSIKIK